LAWSGQKRVTGVDSCSNAAIIRTSQQGADHDHPSVLRKQEGTQGIRGQELGLPRDQRPRRGVQGERFLCSSGRQPAAQMVRQGDHERRQDRQGRMMITAELMARCQLHACFQMVFATGPFSPYDAMMVRATR
jgi:hypothetical protein